jgi:chromosome segregation ATPase
MKRTILIVAASCLIPLIASVGCDTSASDAQISSLQNSVHTLQGQLAEAQASVTNLQGQLAAAQANAVRLEEELTIAKASVSVQTDLAAANAKVLSLGADLASANSKAAALQASLDKLNTDLSAANSNLSKVNNDLVQAKSDLAKANTDLSSQKAINTALTTQLNRIMDPRHFDSEEELTAWLAKDDTNTNPAYASLGLAEKAYVLQVKALRDGYLLPVSLDADNQYVYSWNTAVIGGAIYIVSAGNDSVTALASFGIAIPSHPLPLT